MTFIDTDDQDLAKLREVRLAQLKKEASLDTQSYGSLSSVSQEKEAIHIIANTNRLLLHFRMPAFRRCDILSNHLSKLASTHPKTRFIEVNATEVPFLVAKFKIQVLPCLVAILQGQLVDKIIGFDELGGSDDFPTAILDQRLQLSGALPPPPKKAFRDDSEYDDE